MNVDMGGIIYSLTYALDCIEAELVGVTQDHAKWVAYLSVLMGKSCGFSHGQLSDLAACAALHDNALTQYLDEERSPSASGFLGRHCVLGEENVKVFPFHGNVAGFILYHHEEADGTGPFGKRFSDIPMQARMIHLADILDVNCHVRDISAEKYDQMCAFLTGQQGHMFDQSMVALFFRALPRETYLALAGRTIDELLSEALPHDAAAYSFGQVRAVMDLFGRIVDYKSAFTRRHSEQIAGKLLCMAAFYGYDENTTQRLYVAGALHDIGKMAITNDILEKPDKLTGEEFTQMKNHAWYTYIILRQISGFADINAWASCHHEKLNGTGYPFGKTAAQLDHRQRLLACIDIYQALLEDRPYKKGLPHEKCLSIMRDMAEGGFIDGGITADIDRVFA